MEETMSRISKIPEVQWYLVQFLVERLNRIRIRNAFADAERAQAARLLTQQVGLPFDPYLDTVTHPRKDRSAAIDG
jgi:hypothetical protein